MSKNNRIILFLFLLVLAMFVYLIYSPKSKPQELSQANCSADQNQLKCWQDFLRTTLNSQGLPQAFDALANLYATEPAFAAECHSFAHQLGEDAYLKFAAHQDFELNSKTAYCGYGFYHGFMETLLQTTKDTKQAQDFCAYVGQQLAGQTTDGEGACYHGIGHGAVDGTNLAAWGNPEAMIEPGLNLCKLVASDDMTQYGKFFRCASGAYNALEILSADSKYKLTAIQQNPFYLCPTQSEFNQEACYSNMLPSLLRFTSNDLVKSEKIIERIPEKNSFTLRTEISAGLWHEFIRMNLDQPDYNVDTALRSCHSFTDPFRIACIEGLSGGHMKYGEPTKEYVKGLAFCANAALATDEHDTCYHSILSRLRIWYSHDKSIEICGSVPEDYKKYCSNL